MKRAVFLVFFIIPIFIQAQKIDSLTNELKTAKEAGRKIDIYKRLAIAYSNQGLQNKALDNYRIVLKLAKNDKLLQASTNNEIGNICADLGDNESAFKAYQQALQVLGNDGLSLQAIINKNIGALFLSWEKLDDALKYYLLAEKLAVKAGDKHTIADLANNKGTVYEQQNLFDKAQLSYNKALNFYLKEKTYDRIALTYNNLAILNKVQKKYPQAVVYYQNSVDNATKANNKWLTAAIGNNLGNLLSEMGNYKQGESKLKQALAIEQEIGAKELLQETLENLADNEKRRGNYQLAFNYLKEASEAKNNFINLENTKEVAKLKEQFEAEKKEKQIELLNKESKINKLTLSKKNQTIYVIIVVFLAIAIITYLLFSRYNLKQKGKFQMVALETKHQVQEEKLRISRELHDNIGAQLTFINGAIQNLASQNLENQELQQTQKVTQNTIKELRSTVWLINQQEFSLEEFVVKLRDYLKPYHGGKPAISIVNESDIDCVLEPIIATNLFRVIQEAVNNAIKYADADSLEVKLLAKENSLNVNIYDDGIGFDSTAKTNGYGLKNMQSRVNVIKGSCNVTSEIGKGTEISLQIPIKDT